MPDSFRDDPMYLGLYNISIGKLELSKNAIQVLEEQGLATIADCIDYFVVAHSALITTPHDFAQIMETEVRNKLQNMGYWGFYEKLISD